MTLSEKTHHISLLIDESKKLALGMHRKGKFVQYNNTGSKLEKNKERFGKAIHLEWHVESNNGHKKSEKCVTCCFHVEDNRSQINWKRIVHSDLFKKFEEKVIEDMKKFDKDLIFIKKTPKTWDCTANVMFGKIIDAYWIGFEFSKIKDFENRRADIVLYSYTFGQIIDKYFWLIEDLC